MDCTIAVSVKMRDNTNMDCTIAVSVKMRDNTNMDCTIAVSVKMRDNIYLIQYCITILYSIINSYKSMKYLFWSPTKTIHFFRYLCLIDIKSIRSISDDFVCEEVCVVFPKPGLYTLEEVCVVFPKPGLYTLEEVYVVFPKPGLYTLEEVCVVFPKPGLEKHVLA
jgi:rRNA maturation protein Nop10